MNKPILTLSNLLYNLEYFFILREEEFGIKIPLRENQSIYEFLFGKEIYEYFKSIILDLLNKPEQLILFDYSIEVLQKMKDFSNQIKIGNIESGELEFFIRSLFNKNGLDKIAADSIYNDKAILSLPRKYIKNPILKSLLASYGINFREENNGVFYMENIHLLGFGAHGYAYEINNNDIVLKVTSDFGEFSVANKVMNAQIKNEEWARKLFPEYFVVYDSDSKDYVNKYNVFSERTGIIQGKIYHILMEKLHGFSEVDKRVMDDIIMDFNKNFKINKYVNIDQKILCNNFQYYKDKYSKIRFFNESTFSDDNCLYKFLIFLIEIYIIMFEKDFSDLHAENIMLDSNNNIKAIDLQLMN